ncbi:MAG: 30S ribosomal protein S6 [Ndongobacter sp.]|nr:30S ribosomal protein S6 [Ndongobacter sp.]
MNKYEMVVVFKPQMEEEDRKAILSRLTDAIVENGSVEEIKDWGAKKLAYEINYIKEGYYYLINFEAEPQVIAEVERRARISDQIIRYLTVKKEA